MQLADLVESLWYVRRPAPETEWERVLPSGNAQWVINLAHDACTARTAEGEPVAQAPALVVGLQHQAMDICTRDTEEMVGVVWSSTGLSRWLREPAHQFAAREVPLADVLGAAMTGLRDSLRSCAGPAAKLSVLEHFLLNHRVAGPQRAHRPHPAVSLALEHLRRKAGTCTVAALAEAGGVSERRLRDLFHEEVGVTPKLLARILRFRHAVTELHHGQEVRWAELALDCGFADQSHFCNEFRAFAGVDPTTYSQARRPWAGHLAS